AVEDAEHKGEARAFVGKLDRSPGPRHVAHGAAERVEREDVANFKTVARALVDADDRLGSGFADLAKAAVDADHAAVDLAVGRVRRIGNELRPTRRDQLVAGLDLPGDARQYHGRRVTAALKFRRAEVDGFIREGLVVVRIDQRHSTPEHIPALFL